MKTPVFCGSLSVRKGSRRVRFELAKAEAYGGPAGCYRVRVARVWHDLDGKPAFLTPAQIVNMAVMMTEPIRAQDGLAYVGVSVYGRGVVMLPVNSLSIIGRTS